MIDMPEFRYALIALVIVLLLIASWALRSQFGNGGRLFKPTRRQPQVRTQVARGPKPL